VSACPAVQPSPFTKEDTSNSKSLSQRFFGKIGRLGSRQQGDSSGTPRAALQRRKAAWSVGWTSSRPRSTAAGTLQLCVRSSATPSSLFKSSFQDGRRAEGSHRKPGRSPVGHQRPAGRRHRSPVGRYRHSAAEPSLGRRRAMTLRVMAATRASTMATNCRKQGKTRMGLTNSDHGPGSLSSRRPADETPTKPAYLLGQPSPGTRAPRVSSSRAAGRPGHQRPAAARGISSSSPHP